MTDKPLRSCIVCDDCAKLRVYVHINTLKARLLRLNDDLWKIDDVTDDYSVISKLTVKRYIDELLAELNK